MLFFILLNIILFLLCFYLYSYNKKLKQKIIELEQETKKILERKIINNKEDLIPIENISEDNSKYQKKEQNIDTNQQTQKNKINTINMSNRRQDKKYTARINADEYQEPKIQSPTTANLTINIRKTVESVPEHQPLKKQETKKTAQDKYQNHQKVSIDIDFNPDDFIKKTQNVVSDKSYEYLQQIAKQLENEIITNTIDLTDYEKEQEEDAVISYQELLSLKEKTKNQEQNTKSFLEDLKALRNLLDPKN